MAHKISGEIIFGNTIISPGQIFITRKNVFAMINHKPIIPGHVLVCSRRITPKIELLTEIESLDLFLTAQEVCKKLQTIYNKEYTVALQNGKDAGQTVEHIHLHCMPMINEAVDQEKIEVRTEEDMIK